MNQYSLLIGSFVRTSNFPIEANYIFLTESELVSFFKDNSSILHEGLLKIVLDDGDGNQALYWVVNVDGELLFSKLISFDSVEDLLNLLELLKENLNKEIENRLLGDLALWGIKDSTTIDLDLNSILKLSKAIIALQDELHEVEATHLEIIDDIKALTGSDRDNIQEYLKTLDYGTLTSLSERLHFFLDTIDDKDESINTWPELAEFLKGFDYKHNLHKVLVDLWLKIQGDPLPNEDLRTLRGIEDFIEKLLSYSINRMDNIQSELDLTLVGVGLSGDGSYNADKETYYLKNATSVMNALKILDSLINEAINNCHYESEDTETVKLDIRKEPNKTTIKAWVKVASENGNDIITKNDGIYHNIDSEFENGILTLKVNGNIRKLHDIGLSAIVEDAKYDLTTEELVIVFKLHNNNNLTVRIPLGNLILEWIVDNSDSTKVVHLEKVRVVGGPDKLSADVRISTNKYNILEKEGNTLLVRGTADNIIYIGDVTVKARLDELDNTLQSEIDRSKAVDETLTTNLNNEIQRSTNKDNQLTEAINFEVQRAKDTEKDLDTRLKDEIARSTDNDTALDTAIRDEIARAKSSEHSLEDALESEVTRATNEEEKISTLLNSEILRATDKDTELSNKIQDEITRSINKDLEISDSLTDEINRAKLAELTLQSNINAEKTRAEAKETLLQTNITNELNRAIAAETTLTTNLNAEISRATTKESELEKAIKDESDRAKASETTITTNLQSEINRAKSKEELIDTRIDTIVSNLNNSSTEIETLKTKIDNTNSNLTSEINRAKLAEQGLSGDIASETERATNAETNLTTKVNAVDAKVTTETNRATSAENILTTNLNTTNTNLANEITRSTNKDNELTNSINSEVSRAVLKENEIAKEISDLITKCIVKGQTTASGAANELAKLGTGYSTVQEIGQTLKSFLVDVDAANSTINKWKEIESFLTGITDLLTLEGLLKNIEDNVNSTVALLSNDLTNEITRAKAAEKTLETSLNLEITRATAKDTELSTAITVETTRATNAENLLRSDLVAEITRATTAENKITSDLTTEVNRALIAETALTNSITLEKLRAEAAESLLSTLITNVETTLTKEISNIEKNTEAQIIKEINNSETRIEKLIDNKIAEASIKIDEDKNKESDILLVSTEQGIYAKLVWGEYE